MERGWAVLVFVYVLLLCGAARAAQDGGSTVKPPPVSAACIDALNNITNQDPSTIFQMAQGSGKYLGDWGYVDTCQMVASAQYCLLQVQIDPKGAATAIKLPFEYLKATVQPPPPNVNLTEVEMELEMNMPSYIPRMEWGLCVPKICSAEDITNLVVGANVNEMRLGNGSILFDTARTNCLPTQKEWTAGPIIMVTLTALLGLLAFMGTALDYLKNHTNILDGSSSSRFGSNHPQDYQFLPLDAPDDEMHTFVNPGVIETENENLQDDGEKDIAEEEGVFHNPVRNVVFSLTEQNSHPDDMKNIYGSEPFADFSVYDDVSYLKEDSQPEEELRRSLGGFLMSWSVLYNMRKLFGQSTTQRLDSLNGMRVLSMGWVILAHTLSFILFTGLPDNIFYLLQSFQGAWEWQIVLSGFFAVDTFFFISGFLVSFLLVKELVLKGKVNWIHFYIHRIWRISPVYFFVFMFYWKMTPLLSDGPRYKDNTDMKYCDQYWWANLLYIQNLVPWNFNEECMGWAWYLAVDLQYYILSPLLIYPFYKKKWIGWTLLGILLLGCVLVNLSLTIGFNMTYWYGNNFGQSDFFNQIYTKPWARAYPYLVGVGLGFLLCEKREERSKPPTWLLLLMACCAFTIMGAVVFGPYSLYKHSTAFDIYGSWSEFENVSFITFSRLAWGLALALVAYICIKSPRSILQSILAHPMWTPLARITFDAYLIHPIFLTAVYGSFPRPYHYSATSFAYLYVGNVLFAYILGLLCFLLLERPVMNLEKFLMPQRRRHDKKAPSQAESSQ